MQRRSSSISPADQAEVFNLRRSEQDILLPLLDVHSTADLLEELEDDKVLDAVEGLSTERLADVLDEMEPDEAADLLGDLSPSQASEVLAQMEDADEVVPLLGYPDETAGGLMTTWFIALRRHTTAEQAIEFLRQVGPENKARYYLYVVDRERRLIGGRPRELVVAVRAMEAIMNREVIHVTSGTDQEEVAQVMTRYNLATLPVVDEQHRLLGVVTHDDIADVIEDETTEDILHLGAVETAAVIDRPYWDQKILQVVRSRFLALARSSPRPSPDVSPFRGELRGGVALSSFVPLLIGW
jgi:magnesium transporter